MKACHHASWVEVSDTSEFRLVNPGRFDRLVHKLSNPTRQYPQIVFCVGGEEKQRAIDCLFPEHDIAANRPAPSLANLHIDGSRTHLENPFLFVDCSPQATLPVKKRGRKCHENRSSRVAWTLPRPRAETVILTRLLFPFVDCLCVFADDLGDLNAVFAYLEEWTAGDVATSLPWKARPRVCVITFAPLTPEAHEEQRAFNSRLREIKFRRHFSSVRLVRFWPRSTGAARDRALRQLVLHDELAIARKRRKEDRVLFAAHHLSWFFSRALVHVAKTLHDPFDFITESRLPRPVPSGYSDQLSTFLELAHRHDIPFQTVAAVVASSIAFDAYPSSAHGEFWHRFHHTSNCIDDQ